MMITMTIKGTPTESELRFAEYIAKRNKAFKTFDIEKIRQVAVAYGNKPPDDTAEFWEYVARTVLGDAPNPHQRAEANKILDELNCKL